MSAKMATGMLTYKNANLFDTTTASFLLTFLYSKLVILVKGDLKILVICLKTANQC